MRLKSLESFLEKAKESYKNTLFYDQSERRNISSPFDLRKDEEILYYLYIGKFDNSCNDSSDMWCCLIDFFRSTRNSMTHERYLAFQYMTEKYKEKLRQELAEN